MLSRLLAVTFLTVLVGAPQSWAGTFTFLVRDSYDWCDQSYFDSIADEEGRLPIAAGFQLGLLAFYEEQGCVMRIRSWVTFDCRTGVYLIDESSVEEFKPANSDACKAMPQSSDAILRKFRLEIANLVIPVPKMNDQESNKKEIPKEAQRQLLPPSKETLELFDLEEPIEATDSKENPETEVPVEKIQSTVEKALKDGFASHKNPNGDYSGTISFTAGVPDHRFRLILQFVNPVNNDLAGFALTGVSIRRVPVRAVRGSGLLALSPLENQVLDKLIALFTPPNVPLAIWLRETQRLPQTDTLTSALTRLKAVRKVEETTATFSILK